MFEAFLNILGQQFFAERGEFVLVQPLYRIKVYPK